MRPRIVLAHRLAPALLAATLGCRDVEPPTAPQAATAVVAAAIQPLTFRQISAGSGHTCGVTTDNRAYCWGWNEEGQLGDGTTTDSRRPVAVAGNLRFRRMSAGSSRTCGVTTENQAYCWGFNGDGALGDGTTTDRLTPTAVAGGLRFTQVEAGEFHTCGVSSPDNRAYCWGWNARGQVGDGTQGNVRLVPTPVAGGLTVHQVTGGLNHTCAVTLSDAVSCWGWNRYGQLGDSVAGGSRLTPFRVAGNRRFRQADAGSNTTCGVTTGDRVFCWGNGVFGQVGIGKKSNPLWPKTAVASGHAFRRVSGGALAHTCGETTDNRAFCWGENFHHGELGDGTTTTRLAPVAVVGGLFFAQVSAGGGHTCGRTPRGVAYCWGDNRRGQLGDGQFSDRSLTPVAVAGVE
jgi:alpha-tubulin suppressor-like RCC1 family protein